MAYTGSGTQADPYVVTNLPDLLTCLNMGGKYIKLANDIDCAAESTYTGKITSPLSMQGNHLLSDNGYSVIGLTIEAEAFFLSTDYGAAGYTDNVNFINCVFKQTAPVTSFNPGGIFGCGTYGGITANNCKFSILCSVGAYTCPLFTRLTATDCSFYFKVINNTHCCPYLIVNSAAPSVSFTRCDVVIDGMKMYANTDGNGKGINVLFHYGGHTTFTANTSAIIYKNCSILADGTIDESWWFSWTDGYGCPTFSGSYIATINSTFSTNYGGGITALKGSNGAVPGTASIIATDIDGITLTPDSYSVKPDTVANLKNKQHLIDIGFLP